MTTDLGSSRRQQHQQKLRALIQALDSADPVAASRAYASLLAFSPALAHSSFSRIGEALSNTNLGLARRVIEEIYGQSQSIFRHSPVASVPPPLMAAPMRRNGGMPADYPG